MRDLTVWLKELRIKKFGTIEALNEPYVLSMAIHDRLEGSILSERDDVPTIFPPAFQAFNRYVVTCVSPVFPKTRRGESLNLLGKGIRLLGPVALDGPMQLHVAVMESDSDIRNLGEIMTKSLVDSGVTDLVEGVERLTQLSNGKISAVFNALRGSFSTVLGVLKADRDDVIQAFEFGEDFYQSESPYEETIVLNRNRYIDGSLYLEWNDAR